MPQGKDRTSLSGKDRTYLSGKDHNPTMAADAAARMSRVDGRPLFETVLLTGRTDADLARSGAASKLEDALY